MIIKKSILNKKPSEILGSALRAKIINYYDDVRLEPEDYSRLELLLLNEKNSIKNSLHQQPLLLTKKMVRLGLIQLTVIAATVLLTLIGVHFYHEYFVNRDLLTEVTSLPDAETMPADFNLESDWSGLQELIDDSLPKDKAFMPPIPKQIAEVYSGFSGRFFTYRNQPGVSINIVPTLIAQNPPVPLRPSTNKKLENGVLYIVKLGDKGFADSSSTFPVKKTLRKIRANSGKIKKVYAWREGAYGYAMVQPVSLADNLTSNADVNTPQPEGHGF